MNTAAIAAAEYIYVAFKQHGIVNYDEVLCRPHFDEMSTRGAFTLRPDEEHRGFSIVIRPWNGEPRCTQCDDMAGRGAA